MQVLRDNWICRYFQICAKLDKHIIRTPPQIMKDVIKFQQLEL